MAQIQQVINNNLETTGTRSIAEVILNLNLDTQILNACKKSVYSIKGEIQYKNETVQSCVIEMFQPIATKPFLIGFEAYFYALNVPAKS